MPRTLAALGAITLSLVLVACASSSVTRLSKNTAMINTRAAPICGTSGAGSVAEQMAALETLRAGYERFVILGFGVQDNTSIVRSGPTYSTTTGTFNTIGNTTYGTARTAYGGNMVYVTGGNNAQAQVVMLNKGDAGYEQALDAKTTLGPDWQKKMDKGINSCFGN